MLSMKMQTLTWITYLKTVGHWKSQRIKIIYTCCWRLCASLKSLSRTFRPVKPKGCVWLSPQNQYYIKDNCMSYILRHFPMCTVAWCLGGQGLYSLGSAFFAPLHLVICTSLTAYMLCSTAQLNEVFTYN